MESRMSIKSYYAGKTIFITGGTGFIGKALVAKLLSSCPNLKKIYVLLRPKKGKTPQERMVQLISSSAFNTLRKQNPNLLDKIVAIQGDTSKVGLGLSESDRNLLINEVNVFFNSAASVRFDEPLKSAIFNNTRSAREAATLALEIKKLDVFLHVSTAYCNIRFGQFVEEKLYPPSDSWQNAILTAEQSDDHCMNILSPKLSEHYPNTYTYTKQLGEHCISDLLSEKISTVIVRPTIVTGAIKEPEEGWLDNFNGPVGLSIAGGTGLLRALWAHPNSDLDLVFVDIVVNCIIASAWSKAVVNKSPGLTIYHSCKKDAFSYTVGDHVTYGVKLGWNHPLPAIWKPQVDIVTNYYVFYVRFLLFQLIPAFILDGLALLSGRSPRFSKLQRKVYFASIKLAHFMLQSWTFDDTNSHLVLKTLSEFDKSEFYCVTPSLGQSEILRIYLSIIAYGRIHFLNEPKEITRTKLIRARMLYGLDVTIKLVFYCWILSIVAFKLLHLFGLSTSLHGSTLEHYGKETFAEI